MNKLTSFPKNKIKVLLLENISNVAVENFEDETFKVKTFTKSLDKDALMEQIKDVHMIGIRSKTDLSEEVIRAGKKLLAIGAFCIGTNQIDKKAAAIGGIPVFNAPFSNTRSVAELIISHSISLFRMITLKNSAAHQGIWLKSADNSHEIRGKSIGIVGYGHIGTQVSVLAESLGMKVIFYDIIDKLALGNATKAGSLTDLLKNSDIVTLHLPETELTRMMIKKKELDAMKKGAFLINYSRGNVVDIDALKDAIVSKHLGGAAIDVFPLEPKGKGEMFQSPLQGLDNVILTPHIGGSTQEAQVAIGDEVSRKLIKFINNGSTTMSVNVPNVELPICKDNHRILHFHKNVPGVLQSVNSILGNNGINIFGQHLGTNENIGYLVMDLSKGADKTILESINKADHSIRTRILY